MIPSDREPTHPGEMLLEEFLKPMGIKQTQFASHLKWTFAKLNEIIHKKRGITPLSALDLADAFNMEAEFWMNLQRDWDLYKAKISHKKISTFNVELLSAQ
mgnify:CR=1 FL=1